MGLSSAVSVATSVASPIAAQSESMEPSSATIIVVDDEPALGTIASRILRSAGYTVVSALSGQEALDLVAKHQGAIDLLLTDVVMPGMTGPELAVALRARAPNLRVLFTSGYNDEQVVQQGAGEGEIQFLGKPYSIDQLKQAVATALRA